MKNARHKIEYPFEVRPLSDEEGGGWLASFPDLPGCMADGETPEEAIEEAQDALESYLRTLEKHGDPIPEPGSGGRSGQFVQRLPKSLHARLAVRARQEGVSMNSLVTAFIAEGLAKSETKKKTVRKKTARS